MTRFHRFFRNHKGLGGALAFTLAWCAAAVARAGEENVDDAGCGTWTHFAGNAARDAIAPFAPRLLNAVPWATGPLSEEYVWASAPVVFDGRVFVNARIFEDNLQVGNKLVAYHASTGDKLWETPLEPDAFDSWSSPAVDVHNHAVLLGCGRMLYALDTVTGDVIWQTPLSRDVVNASPAVACDLKNHGTPANRAFITDFGTVNATLYAVNVDPFHPTNNPYQPGAIVWTAALPGSSGNSPAYRDGKVFVASTGGDVRAYTALEGQSLWSKSLGSGGGFFGGVSVRDGYLYAASYVFSGGQSNSRLSKLAVATGALVWQVPCERTCSTPIVTGDGRIYLSGGINGFGSAVKVQAFQDHGNSATLLWDTFQATSGALTVGGWSHQPLLARGRLYVGQLSSSTFDPYVNLRVLDVSRQPADPDFVVSTYAGAGASPAAASGWLYSLGNNGLVAFFGLQNQTDDALDPVEIVPLDGSRP